MLTGFFTHATPIVQELGSDHTFLNAILSFGELHGACFPPRRQPLVGEASHLPETLRAMAVTLETSRPAPFVE